MSARASRLEPWILIPVAAAVALVTIAVVGFLTAGRAGPWPWWGFFPWFPFVGIGIFLGFLFGVFRWSVGSWGWGPDGYRGVQDQSGAILRERYARGEITREQFDEMRRGLDEHRMQNACDDEAVRSAEP